MLFYVSNYFETLKATLTSVTNINEYIEKHNVVVKLIANLSRKYNLSLFISSICFPCLPMLFYYDSQVLFLSPVHYNNVYSRWVARPVGYVGVSTYKEKDGQLKAILPFLFLLPLPRLFSPGNIICFHTKLY